LNDNYEKTYYPQTSCSLANTEFGEAFYFYLNRDNYGDTLENNLSDDTSKILSLENINVEEILEDQFKDF
jgi:hypothetical protein